MKILIAGASGFIGQNLVRALKKKNKITVLGRDRKKLSSLFDSDIAKYTWEELKDCDARGFDALINLCGHSIAAGRWTKALKKKIIDSRVMTTGRLLEWAAAGGAAPHFYCANATGIYGLQGNGSTDYLTEESPVNFNPVKDFLNETGKRWQEAAEQAIELGMKLTITRFSVVLKKGQGMLKQMAPGFNLCLGAVIADGCQQVSWIHIDDVVRCYQFLLNNPELTGAYNLTSPKPVSQDEFAKTLAKAMHRPCFLKVPASIIRLLFGEMGECLVNKGQRVLPERLEKAGFVFRYPALKEALQREFLSLK